MKTKMLIFMYVLGLSLVSEGNAYDVNLSYVEKGGSLCSETGLQSYISNDGVHICRDDSNSRIIMDTSCGNWKVCLGLFKINSVDIGVLYNNGLEDPSFAGSIDTLENYTVITNIPRINLTKDSEVLRVTKHYNYRLYDEILDHCMAGNHIERVFMLCSWSVYVEIFFAMLITIVITTGILIVACKTAKCGFINTRRHENVRMINQNGRFIRKQDNYSFSHTKNKAKKSGFILLCLTIPNCRSCSLIPIISGGVELCDYSCSDKSIHQATFMCTDDVACFSMDNAKIQLSIISHEINCLEEVNYYTPIGSIGLKYETRCNGDSCYKGSCTDPHFLRSCSAVKGGWFNGCWSWEDSCYVISYNFKLQEMCRVVTCAKKTVSLAIKIIYDDKEKVMTMLEGERKNIFGMSIMFSAKQRYLTGSRFLDCSGSIYKEPLNERNEGDAGKFGYIQCPSNEFNKDCMIDIPRSVHMIRSGELVSDIMLYQKNYKDLISRRDNGVFSIPFQDTGRIDMFILTNKTKVVESINLNGWPQDFKIRGQTDIENGALLEYICPNNTLGTYQLLCYSKILFSLKCATLGPSNRKITINGVLGSSKIICSLINSIGVKTRTTVDTELSNPVIGLLEHYVVYGEDGSHDGFRVRPDWLSVLYDHLYVFMIMILICIMVAMIQVRKLLE